MSEAETRAGRAEARMARLMRDKVELDEICMKYEKALRLIAEGVPAGIAQHIAQEALGED